MTVKCASVRGVAKVHRELDRLRAAAHRHQLPPPPCASSACVGSSGQASAKHAGACSSMHMKASHVTMRSCYLLSLRYILPPEYRQSPIHACHRRCALLMGPYLLLACWHAGMPHADAYEGVHTYIHTRTFTPCQHLLPARAPASANTSTSLQGARTWQKCPGFAYSQTPPAEHHTKMLLHSPLSPCLAHLSGPDCSWLSLPAHSCTDTQPCVLVGARRGQMNAGTASMH